MAGTVYYEDIVNDRFDGRFRLRIVDDVLTRAQMSRIVHLMQDATESGEWRRATVVNEQGEEVIDESRTSESIAIPASMDDLEHAIRRRVADVVFGDVRLANAYCPGADSRLQIQRYYGRGGRFDEHHDSIAYTEGQPFPVSAARPGSRLLTAFLYLNGPFSGPNSGVTEFPRINTTVGPKKNRVASWPNYTRNAQGTYVAEEFAVHSARPLRIETDVKYGMNIWFCYTPGVFELERPIEISDDDESTTEEETEEMRKRWWSDEEKALQKRLRTQMRTTSSVSAVTRTLAALRTNYE